VGLEFHKILKERLGGKTLSSVASELGIPKSLLHDWVHSGRIPSLKNLKHIEKLAEYLKMPKEQLLFGCEESKVISSISFSDENRKYKIDIKRVD